MVSKRTSVDAQLLDIEKEELKLKKATLPSIKSSQEKHAATVQMLGENLKNSTAAIKWIRDVRRDTKLRHQQSNYVPSPPPTKKLNS